MNENDRVSIIEFCRELKINCSLIEKQTQEKMLRKELLNSMKTRETKGYANVMKCLRKVVERVAHLEK